AAPAPGAWAGGRLRLVPHGAPGRYHRQRTSCARRRPHGAAPASRTGTGPPPGPVRSAPCTPPTTTPTTGHRREPDLLPAAGHRPRPDRAPDAGAPGA